LGYRKTFRWHTRISEFYFKIDADISDEQKEELIQMAQKIFAGFQYDNKISSGFSSFRRLIKTDITHSLASRINLAVCRRVGFKLTGIGGIDSIEAILIAIFSFCEGRESF
jgi:hypothetical protein